MNRDKGFFRLAAVLSPVFGIGLYLIDRLFIAYSRSFAHWVGDLFAESPRGLGVAIFIIMIG